MKKQSSDIIILVKEHQRDTLLYKQEVAGISRAVKHLSTQAEFCRTHELVNRNYITSKRSLLLRFLQENENLPFRFLINKN